MSRLFAGLATLALVAAPAAAAGYGFEATYTGAAVPAAVGTLNITVNPDLVRETNSIRSNDNGVSYIAPRDADDLIEALRDDLVDELTEAGRYGGAGGTLNVTIDRATPSNPAHTENGRNANLDFRSLGRGGATLTAELVGADGAPVATYTYRWEESTFDVETLPRIGWYGAERAFDRFADRLARELSSETTAAPGT